MAIRFVDVEPEKREGAGAAPARRIRGSEAASAPAPDLVEDARPAETETSDTDAAPLPGLPHAKPEPKPRGRKKPLSAAAGGRPKAAEAAPLLEGLLPELQAHAKPVPKPRGRKKAFG